MLLRGLSLRRALTFRIVTRCAAEPGCNVSRTLSLCLWGTLPFVTLSELSARLCQSPARPDHWARLIGYVVLLRVNGGWDNVAMSRSTITRVKRELRRAGVDWQELEL